MGNLNQNICFAATVGGEAFIKSGGGGCHKKYQISSILPNILDSTEKKISLISNVWKDYWVHSSSYCMMSQICAILFHISEYLNIINIQISKHRCGKGGVEYEIYPVLLTFRKKSQVITICRPGGN